MEQRISAGSIGFNAEVVNRNEMDIDELLRKVEPQDLTKFGLIPEFIGRVPVEVSLEQLTKEAMVRILSEPKNALTKQYQKLFELDNVKLEFKTGEPEFVYRDMQPAARKPLSERIRGGRNGEIA